MDILYAVLAVLSPATGDKGITLPLVLGAAAVILIVLILIKRKPRH